MGKVRKAKSYRQHQPAVPVVKKAKDAAVDEEDAPVEDKEDAAISALSRGQRKRQKRRDAFNKKMGMVERSILQKKKEAKKESDGMFGDLDDLQQSLFSETMSSTTATDAAPKAPTKLTGKQKKRLAIHELGHLKAVHSHPSFQANPFAAIQMHLQNTVVAAQAVSNPNDK